jgi:hypothetical protein
VVLFQQEVVTVRRVFSMPLLLDIEHHL